jgi:glycosyltransferase involved in cell wall biosynthesis
VRLGVLTTSYPRTADDPAGSFVAGLTRELGRRGFVTDVLAAGDGEGRIPSRLFYAEGAPERLSRSPRAWLDGALFTARLWREARRRGWDAVISHWLLPCGVIGARLGLPHLAIAHSGDVHLATRAPELVVRTLLQPGTRIGFVAHHLRERLAAGLRDRRALDASSFVCPMGTDVGPRAPRVPGRTVGFLGRLVPIKGVETLVEATSRLAGTRLVVAGDGPLREAIAAAARRRRLPLSLLGEVPRETLFAQIDVLAVPSVPLVGGRTEGAPLVVLEALAAGVPLVASDLPGIRALADGAADWARPGDPTSLAAALEAALANPERHRPAAARLAALHRWCVIAERLLDGARFPYTARTREGEDSHVEHG